MPDGNRSFLRVSGSQIVDGAGTPVQLHGIGLAGWLTMENWITGFPGHEDGQRMAVRHVLGAELSDFFFDRFVEHFFTAADAAYLASLGLNMIRLPFHYRLLEDDDAPFEIRPDGFKHIDRLIRQCADHGILTVLDLHVVPGWQNSDWHCDNPTHTSQFWRQRVFQDRVVNLWRAIADHYRDEPWVAGYNPINEPADPTATKVGPYYLRLVETIREIDQNHIIFLDGNRYAHDFHIFGDPLPNVVYSPHDYPPPGFTPGVRYPGVMTPMHVVAAEEGDRIDTAAAARDWETEKYWGVKEVEQDFLTRIEYMRGTGTPIMVGEFNAIFTGDQEIDDGRVRLLTDQLGVFRKYDASWTYWAYKDVGVAAPLMLAPDSPWMRRVRPVLEKKQRLAVDLWGGDPATIAHVLDPVREVFRQEFPDYSPFPWGAEFMIKRLIPQILFSEAMLPEFGELFRGMTETEIDEMMRSFRLENCRPREPLVALLRQASAGTTDAPANLELTGPPQDESRWYVRNVINLADPLSARQRVFPEGSRHLVLSRRRGTESVQRRQRRAGGRLGARSPSGRRAGRHC